MKLKEIKTKIYDDVCLYKVNGNDQEYKNLWEGKMQDVPDEFLGFYVGIIGAKRKGVIDIELRALEE